MNAGKNARSAEGQPPHAHGALNRSQERLESARAVLARAAAQLCQADAVLRGEPVAASSGVTNILEYVDRNNRSVVPSPRNTIERTRPWTRELANLRGRAAKCGLRAGGQLNPLAQVTEDTLATCESMLQELAAAYMECERLRGDMRAESDAWEHLFIGMPLACIVADRNGCILDANHAAGALLNLGPKRLKGRNLLVFSQDRSAFMSVVHAAADQTGSVTASLIFRPRERKPLSATILVVPPLPDSSGPWLWFLTQPGATTSSAAIDSGDGDATGADLDVEVPVRCPRCGDGTPGGPHASDEDCVDALERRIRGLHSRIAEVQDRCAVLATRQLAPQPVEHRS
jgi:PAS domain-containing protein